MTISSTTNRISYAGNGSTTVFSFPYKFLDEDHLTVVSRNDTTGVETTKTITTHYTVTGEGVAAGGSVTMLVAPATGTTLIIYNDPDQLQGTDFVENDALPVEDVEEALDLLTLLVQRQSNRMDRAVRLSDGFSPTFDPTLPVDLDDTASKVPLVNSDGDGWADGADWIDADDISNAEGYANDAAASALLASQWATLTSGQVAATDYSAKAWAIGGTGVTDTAGKGAAKEWAIETASTVDGTSYSAKEWAIGTQIRGAASGGSSKDWATYVSGTVDNAGYSSKEWAVGTQTRGIASSGSAKDWATYTASTVDDAGYSAKEWATGTQTRLAASGGSAKDWATRTTATVDNTDYSAKEYAVGTTVTAGSAKDWATKTSSTVIAANYSAKEWATGTQTRGAASGGSAKDWATYTSGTVDNSEYSAKYYSQAAAASAAAAATTLASALWRGMRRKTSADSPYTVTSADNGYLIVCDTTSGAIAVTMPQISGLTLPFTVGIQLDAGTSAITVTRGGTDTLDGATSKTLTVIGAGAQFLADTAPAPDEWEVIDFGAQAGNLSVDRFSGDGSTVAFTLSVDPGSENNTFVMVGGVYQQKDTYSVSGTTLTFSTAPPSGTDNIEVVTGTLLTLGTPSDGTVTKAKMDTTTTTSQKELSNLSVSCSVGSSALTVAIKDQAGSTPSSSSPVTLSFRSSTAATGTYTRRQITGALSVVVSSGSTLGHADATNHYMYLYALDNSGTIELAISSAFYDEGSIVTTTAEGGAGAADSSSVIYSTTARSNVPIRLLARLKSNQTTAGTWAAVPTEVSLITEGMGPFLGKAYARYTKTSAQTVNNGATDILVSWTKDYDSHNGMNATSGVYTVKEAGRYNIHGRCSFNMAANASYAWQMSIYKNGSLVSQALTTGELDAGGDYVVAMVTDTIDCAKDDTIDLRFYQASGNNRAIHTSATLNIFTLFKT